MNKQLLFALTMLSCFAVVPNTSWSQQPYGCVDDCAGGCADGCSTELFDGRFGILDRRRKRCLPGCQCPSCKHWHPWVSAEYMMGWTKGSNTPPLVTTSSPQFGGVIGAGDTRVLHGGDVNGGLGSGAKFDVGAWFNQDIGIGGSFFGFLPETDDFNIMSNPASGVPLLALPYNDVSPPTIGNNARIISAPAGTIINTLGTGSIDIDYDTEILGAQAYLRTNVYNSCGMKVDLVGGYHFSRLSDKITLTALSTDLSNGNFLGGGATGDTRFLQDRFKATNTFHGGSLGFRSFMRQGRFSLSFLAKASFGNMNQRVTIDGLQVNNFGGTRTTFTAGTYALNTNIGTYQQNVNAVIPELELKVGYDICRGLNFTVGYSATYWSQVVLAGQAINGTLDDRQFQDLDIIGAATQPAFNLTSTEYWLQGLTFGLEKQF